MKGVDSYESKPTFQNIETKTLSQVDKRKKSHRKHTDTGLEASPEQEETLFFFVISSWQPG